MYFHYQNLKKEEKTSKHISNGRFWLGRKPQFHCEWVIPGRDLSLEISLNDGDDAIGGKIGMYLFTIYWSIEWHFLYRLLKPLTRRRDQKYTNGRRIGFYLSEGYLSLMLWHDPMESRSSDPWWWHKFIDLRNLFLGKSTYNEEILEERDVLIPMPEKTYEAHAKLYISTWTRPRWFSKSIKRVSIDIPGGIPVPGKGENSWDCGDDAHHGMTCAANSIAHGVGQLVGGALHERVRHGGWNNWLWNK